MIIMKPNSYMNKNFSQPIIKLTHHIVTITQVFTVTAFVADAYFVTEFVVALKQAMEIMRPREKMIKIGF